VLSEKWLPMSSRWNSELDHHINGVFATIKNRQHIAFERLAINDDRCRSYATPGGIIKGDVVDRAAEVLIFF